MGSSVYDATKGFAEHEVDITGLVAKTFYWVYCYSLDDEIPSFNTVTSSQMLATERSVRTLDTTPPSFGTFACAETPLTEDSITVTLSMNEAGRAYCKVVNRGFDVPTPNAVIAEGFYADVSTTSDFTITVNQITTGLGATGMEPLNRKWDYDVYCWAQDAEGYPYYGPNGMAASQACPNNYVTTLDLTNPNLRFIMAESISNSQIIITLQVPSLPFNECNATPLTMGKSEEGEHGCGNFCGGTGRCDRNKNIPQQITVLRYGVQPGQAISRTCFEGCSASEMSGKHFSEEFVKAAAGFANPEGVAKALIYGGLHVSGAVPDWDVDYVCKRTFDMIVMKCPRGYFKCTKAFDSQYFTLNNPKCKAAWDNLGVTSSKGDYVCSVVDWSNFRHCDSRQVLYCSHAPDCEMGPVSDTANASGAMARRRALLLLSFLLGWHAWSFALHTKAPPARVALCSAGSEEPPASVRAASLNLAKNLVGSGILSLPAGVAAFSSSSRALPLALAVLALCATLSAYTFYVIGKVCQQTETSTFGAAWEKSLKSGKWIPQCICIFECLGGAVVYAMVLGDVFSGLLQSAPVPALLASRSTVILVISAVLFPLCCLRSFAQLAKFSLLGTLATTYVVIFVVKRFLDGSYAAGGAFYTGAKAATGAASFHSMLNPQVLVLVALLSTAFLVHFNAPQFFSELPPAKVSSESEGRQKLRDFSRMSLIGFGIASVQYALVMCFGFLTFGKDAAGNLLLNYSNLDPWAAGARVAVGVSMLFGYPMQFAGFRDGILEMMKVKSLPKVRHRLVTAAMLSLAVGVALVFRDLGLVQAVEGALLAAFLVFLAGPLMALRLPMGRSKGAKLGFAGLVTLGLAFMCLSVWCAAWATDPGLTSANYQTPGGGRGTLIKAQAANCQDVDDIDDGAADGVTSQAEYDSSDNWKYNQDFDIIISGLAEETDYPYIYCYAEDDARLQDEPDGLGTTPNVMIFDDVVPGLHTSRTLAGPDNVHTIWASTGTVQTLDESPPEFTTLAIKDPSDFNDRLVVTFALNEAGTAYCRATRSDSGETDLRINRILSANYYATVAAASIQGTITIDKLESSDTQSLYEASQYDVYCWAMDSAVNTQGLPRPNYMTQDYVNTPVGTTLAHAQTSPSGGKTTYVWVKDLTPPAMIFVSSEALSEDTVQITLQLNEPGTVWCMPTLPTADATYVDSADITSGNFKDKITGASSPVTFVQYVPQAYTNVDLEVDKVVRRDCAALRDMCAAFLARESLYNIFCFASDDWDFEATGAAQQSINFQSGNVGPPNEARDRRREVGQVITLDLTPPTIQINGVSTTEDTITVNLELSETGTAWCQAVRHGFNAREPQRLVDVPTILEILDSNFTTEYYHYSPTTVPVDVVILGYDRPRNYDPTYMTPLQLGTYYDVYCYADDDLCQGCKVTNGVSFSYVSTSANQLKVRTLDLTPPQMRFIAAESIAHDQIIITLQVDEGAKVWCAAWATDPVLTATAQARPPVSADSVGRAGEWLGGGCGVGWGGWGGVVGGWGVRGGEVSWESS
ncbi:unnamed protein product [Effrenium voratum]|uniref:Amino acid transporter transmembrane domain-containing protein n=1 Tax=Effrenium voratum TaxID=2562239 RepID=A0AA36IK11_9DINO|nr:unnamed protein product [Effrenium voratum]